MKKNFNSTRYGADASAGEIGDVNPAQDPNQKVTDDKGNVVENTKPPIKNRIQNFSPTYIDFTDAYANQGKVIEFTHVPSNTQVFFKAFITTFNETYSSNWKEETVYGRNDPIFQYQNTVRKITLAFKVPAATKSEAFENLGRISKLAQFLYPYYDNPNNAATIAQSPLIRIKMMNMIASSARYADGMGGAAAQGRPAGQYGVQFGDLAKGGPPAAAWANTSASEALLGVVSNLSYAHNLDGDAGVIEFPGGVLPKLIEVNLDFAVIHESPLGWNTVKGLKGLHFRSKAFPYGIDLGDEENLEESKGPQAIIAQNAQRFNQIVEDQQAAEEDRVDAINEQAKQNAEARYLNAKGELSKVGALRLKRDSKRMQNYYDESHWRYKKTSDSLGAAASAWYAHDHGGSGFSNDAETAGRHFGGDDYWDFIE